MGWPKVLVLVRHAESEGNVRTVEERAKFEMSTAEYPLTARGREQARITGEYLRQKYGKFDCYHASYYERALETMRLMFPDVNICEDARLAEGQRGIFHTMTEEEIVAHFPKEIPRKTREKLYHYRPFGGENWADIELRIHSFLTTLSRDYNGDKVVVVVHGHWLILFNRIVQRLSITEAMRQYSDGEIAPNASITVYRPSYLHDKLRLVMEEQYITPWKTVLDEKPSTLA